MTQKYTLLAMAQNYRNGHCWDHLDGEVVTKAAAEIKALEERVAFAEGLLENAQYLINEMLNGFSK